MTTYLTLTKGPDREITIMAILPDDSLSAVLSYRRRHYPGWQLVESWTR